MTTIRTHFIPLVTIEQFSSTCGVTIRTVEAWVMRGHIPTVKIGRYRLVNVAALVAQADLESLKRVTGNEIVSQTNAQQNTPA